MKLRLWVINHFKILPTDQRYKELDIDQIELLFHSFLVLPSDEQFKEKYLEERRKRMTELPIEQLREMGYSEEEIRAIAEDIGSLANE